VGANTIKGQRTGKIKSRENLKNTEKGKDQKNRLILIGEPAGGYRENLRRNLTYTCTWGRKAIWETEGEIICWGVSRIPE